MNSIDGVLARIQEILNRIHEIQATQGRVQGMGPGASSAHQPLDAPRTTGTSSQALSSTKTAQFQQLLQDALAAGTTGSSSGTSAPASADLGGLGNLESILGSNATAGIGATGTTLGTTAAGNAGALQQYRNELVLALRELAAQKQKNQTQ